MSAVARRPERGWFVNPGTGSRLHFQTNPEQITEHVMPEWQRLEVLGLSHRPHQYTGTANRSYSFELTFFAEQASPGRADDARRYLMGACYSSRDTREAPRLLLGWPSSPWGSGALTCVVVDLENTWERFAPDGTCTELRARITVEESRDMRLYAEDL